MFNLLRFSSLKLPLRFRPLWRPTLSCINTRDRHSQYGSGIGNGFGCNIEKSPFGYKDKLYKLRSIKMGKLSSMPNKAQSHPISKSYGTVCKKSITFQKVLSKLGKFVLMVLSFFVYYGILIPSFIVLVSPLYIYRLIVISFAKLFRSDFVRIVSARDGIVGLDNITQKCQCVINIILTYQGKPDLEKIRHSFQNNVMNVKHKNGDQVYEKFLHYYESWMGYVFWKKEENFSLQDHIRFCEETEEIINNNNNDSENVITEEKLMHITGPISTRHFRKGQSPWEALIVRNFVPSPGRIHTNSTPTMEVGRSDEKDKFVIIFRVHHAISDGYSLLKLVMTNLSNKPISSIPQTPPKKTSMLENIMIYMGLVFLSPYYHLKQFFLDVDRNFWHVREKQLTKDWYTIRSERVSMNELKEISKAHKATLTAILLAGFGSGIQTFLKKTGQGNKMPKIMRALAPMPWKNHPMNGLVNHWTLGPLVLPVGIDCLQHKLRVAEKSVKLLKSSPILLTNFATVPLLMVPPSWLTDIWATNWMTTMILSNFPGPNFPIKSFDQYDIEDVSFCLPQMRGSSSIGVSFMSYNGGMRITVTIDKKIIPTQQQADFLAECINQEIRNLNGVVSSGENIV